MICYMPDMLVEILLAVIMVLLLATIYLTRKLNRERGRPSISIINKKTSNFESQLVDLRKSITDLRDQFSAKENATEELKKRSEWLKK